MEKKKKIGFMLLICVLLGIYGCSKETNSPSKQKFQSEYMEVFGGKTEVKEGLFNVVEGVSYFTDFATNTSVPICNKPNCRHLSFWEDPNTTCNAAQERNSIFPYKGKLYGLRNTDEGNSELTVSELDGSNLKGKTVISPEHGSVEGFVIVHNQMYYTMYEVVEEKGKENAPAIPKDCWALGVLNLDTMESEIFLEKEGLSGLNLLGGTAAYQIYAFVKDNAATFYQLDYKTRESKEIKLIAGGYNDIITTSDKNCFYYVGGEDATSKNVYRYHMDTGENEICISADEITNILGEDFRALLVYGFADEGIVFGVVPQNRLFLKEEESGKLRELSLPQNLPVQEGILDSSVTWNDDGMYFDYFVQKGKESGETITWYAYISWKDLLADKNKVKVIIPPRASSLGNLVEESDYNEAD